MTILSSGFNAEGAMAELDALENSSPPPQPPRSFREFVDQNRDRITALVSRGWSADQALSRIAEAAGVAINLRTARAYLRRPTTPQQKRGPGRPRKHIGGGV